MFLAGVDGCVETSEEGPTTDALTALQRLLEKSREEVEALDAELRKKMPKPRRAGRERVNYPPPFLGAAARLYTMGYSYAKICRAVNSVVGPQHRMGEETLRNRLVEAGIKPRNPSEAVRRATLKGQRKPPKNTVQKAVAAALAQTDAALRVKGETMLELVINTPHEAYARTIAKIFQEHGTISLGARRFTENYYEWQLIVRLDLKDWGFLIDCKRSMRVPSFVKTGKELRAYLAMMLACEGYITWAAQNTGRTKDPKTSFSVAVLTNTNTTIIKGVKNILTRLGYTPLVTQHALPGHKHIDSYGRLYVTRQACYRLSLYRKEDVRKFLQWLGPIPHPMKEAYRLWALRLLREGKGMPVRWAVAKPLKTRLDTLSETSVEMGRRRAKIYFEKVQEEMNNGKRIDTRPLKAQTDPLPLDPVYRLTSNEVMVLTLQGAIERWLN